MMTTCGSPWNVKNKNKNKQNKNKTKTKTTDRTSCVKDQYITCWLADDKGSAHSYVLTSFRYGCGVDCGLNEHSMISVSSPQAFNMAAVLTDLKNKQKTKQKHTRWFQSAAHKLSIWPQCGLLTDGTGNDFGQNHALKWK